MRISLRHIGGLGLLGLVLTGCAASSSTTPSTVTASPVDCSVVTHALAAITQAKQDLTTANDTTSAQIASAVGRITTATAQLATQAQSALPGVTVTYLQATEAYDKQIQQGARDGKSPTFLIQAAQSFDTAGYQNAAKAISSYLSSACPS